MGLSTSQGILGDGAECGLRGCGVVVAVVVALIIVVARVAEVVPVGGVAVAVLVVVSMISMPTAVAVLVVVNDQHAHGSSSKQVGAATKDCEYTLT